MCRTIRNHPIKSLFGILLTFCILHLFYRGIFLEFIFLRWNTIGIIGTNNNYVTLDSNQTLAITTKLTNYSLIPACSVDVTTIHSQLSVDRNVHQISELEHQPWGISIKDGAWKPRTCRTEYSMALIVPYRDRHDHLMVMLNHMHPFLQRQLIHYRIFVIEQAAGTKFNRAALFNVGYLRAVKSGNFDCFVFHDVDLLPVNDHNFYRCSTSPQHLSVAIDKFNYKLPYADIFGGAVAFTKQQFIKVNGFSNIFFGWGGEDDDMASRLKANGYSISRYPKNIARYEMIKHSGDKGNPANPARFKLLKDSKTRYKKDGFKSSKYEVLSIYSESRLYAKVLVQFPEKAILKQWKLK